MYYTKMSYKQLLVLCNRLRQLNINEKEKNKQLNSQLKKTKRTVIELEKQIKENNLLIMEAIQWKKPMKR